MKSEKVYQTIPGDLFLTDFTNDEFKFEKISPEMIQETILQIETKTSLDIDGLNTKVLKSVASCIACPLAHIFNLSFESGLVPTIDSRFLELYQFLKPEHLTFSEL